jgi:ribosomal protein L11 methyltransferase
MHPTLTYELKVAFTEAPAAALATKQKFIDWLLVNGVESFVEGELACDINQNQDEPPRDFYAELGGDLTPVVVYRYSRETLDDLRAKMARDFPRGVEATIGSMATETWMEGWKSSFRPFAAGRFFVRPPWEAATAPAGLAELVIEPGMAFGTGQHATTRLCLEALSSPAVAALARGGAGRALDVGTGTGILALGALRLGFGAALGTDIEDDALLAARENARLNGLELPVRRGSLPEGERYELVLANILAMVLVRLMPELAAALAPGGRLVLSGLLVTEEDEVIAAASEAGLVLEGAHRLDGWSALVVKQASA